MEDEKEEERRLLQMFEGEESVWLEEEEELTAFPPFKKSRTL